MGGLNKTHDELLAEITDLRQKLDEASDTLNAIRNGEVDALVVSALDGEKIYTLQGADYTSRVLLEQMQEGALVINSDGFILFGNKYLEQLMKCPLENITGESLFSFLSPADSAAFDSYIKQSSLRKARGELQLSAKDGSMVPVSISISMVQIEQEEFRFIVITDLTERKSNEEERLRIYKRVDQIFNATPIGICVIDLEGRITQVNNSFLRMFNFEEMKVIGKKYNEVLLFGTFDPWAPPTANSPNNNQIENFEFSKIFPGGKKLHFSVVITPLMDLEGHNSGFINNFIDISGKMELEGDFQKLLEKERQDISYDLRESLCQKLVGMNFLLESIRLNLETTTPHLGGKLNDTMDILQSVISQAKDLSWDISPIELTPEGFMNAIEELGRTIKSTFGINCIIASNENIFFSDNLKANHVYNIILEAVNNSTRHRLVKNIYLNFISRGGYLVVSISDDGKCALETEKTNIEPGLRIMKYRARAIGATFELSDNLHGSYYINIKNIHLT